MAVEKQKQLRKGESASALTRGEGLLFYVKKKRVVMSVV